MNIALLSILSLAASADTLVVEKADLVSSAPLIRPYQTDSVNLKEKTLDLKEALEKNKKDLFKSYLNEIIKITEKLQESILKDSDEKLVYKIVCEPRQPRVLVFDGNW